MGDLWDQMQAYALVNEEPMDLHWGFFVRKELEAFYSCYLDIS